MNSVNDIWNYIMEQLRLNLPETALNTWFTDITPVELVNNSLVIHTPTNFKRDILEDRFADMIRGYLKELFACDYELTILAEDELSSYTKQGEDKHYLPEADGYTFDNFIVGSSNKYAHAAALAVANNPGGAYNPLFIYGNSGLGKTHLLRAIGQAIHENNASFKIAYIKGDGFTNELIRAIRENRQAEFHDRYRQLNLLLVDDIQFISGKIQTQEEFFHTFNALYEAGAQIVITSDRAPMEIAALEDRLRTRFEGGLMADIQPPDIETRMAIIRNKASQLGLPLSDEIVQYIGETIKSNIRLIEGVVKRLTAYKEILNTEIQIEDVKRAIKDVIRIGVFIPTPDIIIEETARYFTLDAEDLKSKAQTKNTALARQIAMYLIRSLANNISLIEIGKIFDRNHSTVLSSIRKVETLLQSDPKMSGIIRDISSNINSRE